MVFCVGCGNQLLGRYCRQCGAEDSQWTAHAQSQVPVLTIPTAELAAAAEAKKKKQSKSRKGGKSAASAALKSNGSAAGGIGVAQASGHVPESHVRALPAAIASTASGSPAVNMLAAQGGKKGGGRQKIHAGPGKPPAKAYVATDADKQGTRSIAEFFREHQPRPTARSKSSSSAPHPSTSEPTTPSKSASSAQPSTTISAACGVLAAAVTLPAAALNAVSSGLAALSAYASGSDDEGENHAAPAIDVEAAALSAEEQRVQKLRTKWTQKILTRQQNKQTYVSITLTDTLIDSLEAVCKAKKRKAVGVRTSWSDEDKKVVMEVYHQLNSKY